MASWRYYPFLLFGHCFRWEPTAPARLKACLIAMEHAELLTSRRASSGGGGAYLFLAIVNRKLPRGAHVVARRRQPPSAGSVAVGGPGVASHRRRDRYLLM